jgi:hypothetical protein
VQFRPPSGATITKRADGPEGLVAAVVMPHRARFGIRIVPREQAPQLLRVRLR